MAKQMQRPGGRTKQTRDAVLTAVAELMAERGYDGLSIDAVAQHSGVHKTTIYRRWSTVDSLLLDAVSERARVAIPLVSTGDPVADLIAMGCDIAANLADPLGRGVAAAALAQAPSNEFDELVRDFWAGRMSAAAAIVAEGKECAVIDSDADPEELVERIVAPIWFRSMVMRTPVRRSDVEALVEAAIAR